MSMFLSEGASGAGDGIPGASGVPGISGISGISGGGGASITMGYEFNLLGRSTTLKGWKSVSYPMIQDDPVVKEIPKEKESGFSLGKVIKYAVAGLAVVGAVAAVAAYGASVVLSGGATLAAAPTLVPAIIGFGTAMAGSMYVLNKAESDIQSQQNSGILDYVYEALVGSTRGMISSALFAYAEPVKLAYVIGTGFVSGNIGSSYEQFMRKGNIDIKQSLKEGSIEGALTGVFFVGGKIISKYGSKLMDKMSSVFKGKSSGAKPIAGNGAQTKPEVADIPESTNVNKEHLSTIKGGKGSKIFNPVEYEGTVKVNGEVRDVSRKVYQRNDIDFDYIDDTTGLTNLERMQAGKPPIGTDGNAIQLHHILQKEAGPMAEIREITHQEYYSQLHGLIEDGASFRNDPILNKQYNNFRRSYWKWRAEQITGGK